MNRTHSPYLTDLDKTGDSQVVLEKDNRMEKVRGAVKGPVLVQPDLLQLVRPDRWVLDQVSDTVSPISGWISR